MIRERYIRQLPFFEEAVETFSFEEFKSGSDSEDLIQE